MDFQSEPQPPTEPQHNPKGRLLEGAGTYAIVAGASGWAAITALLVLGAELWDWGAGWRYVAGAAGLVWLLCMFPIYEELQARRTRNRRPHTVESHMTEDVAR
jgi:hypothetical protein